MTIPDSTSTRYKSVHQVMTPHLQLFAVSVSEHSSFNELNFHQILGYCSLYICYEQIYSKNPYCLFCYFSMITHLYNKTLLS